MKNDWVEVDGYVFRWPFCEVRGCQNRIYRRVSDRWCWPHMMSGEESAITLRPVSENLPVE